MRRAILHRRPPAEDGGASLEPQDLTGLFTPARWLRDLGRTSWLAVGVALFVVAAVWLLSLTQIIVMPVITAAVIAAVASPVVTALERRGVPRGVSAALLLVAAIVLAAAVVLVVLGGITSQTDHLRAELGSAKDTIAGWLTDLGVDQSTATKAKADASDAVSSAVPALLKGLGNGLAALSSLVVFLAFTALSLFFLLKDGPLIRHWAEGHTRLPLPVAHQMGDRVLQSLRGYFLGVTIIALFNAVVVMVGAAILGVPLRRLDRPRDLPRRLRPVPRRLERRDLRRAGRARGRRHRRRDRDDRRPAPGQRAPAATRPAVRLRGGARHPSTRGPHRHDRRRRAVRRRSASSSPRPSPRRPPGSPPTWRTGILSAQAPDATTA